MSFLFSTLLFGYNAILHYMPLFHLIIHIIIYHMISRPTARLSSFKSLRSETDCFLQCIQSENREISILNFKLQEKEASTKISKTHAFITQESEF